MEGLKTSTQTSLQSMLNQIVFSNMSNVSSRGIPPLQIETATGTVQTTFSLHLHKRRAKKNFLTLLTDHNRTVLNEEHYLSITAYSKTATLKI